MKTKVIALAAAAALVAPAALAQDDFSAQLKARQGQFRIMALNIGVLGGMAQGKIEYDAEAAQTAADSLVAISGVDQGKLWPEGTDEVMLEGTRAKVAIWENFDDFASKWAAYGEQAAAIQAVAGDGLEAVGPAVQELGGTCKACHDDYRAPDE